MHAGSQHERYSDYESILSGRPNEILPSSKLRQVIGWRILLVGVFLTPFMRFGPIAGVGFSFGDALLILGGTLILTKRSRQAITGPSSLALSGCLLIAGVLLSTLINPTAQLPDAMSLAGQYAFVLIFLPPVIARLDMDQLIGVMKSFLYGVSASVLLGLVIVTFFQGIQEVLVARGFMVALATGRNGFFSGVGELSKMSAMALPLLYFLTLRGHLHIRRAALIFISLALALIVTRSGLGSLAALTSIAIVGAMHLVTQPASSSLSNRPRAVKTVMVLLIGAVGLSLVFQQLTERGFDYTAAFTERIANPLSEEGVEAVGSGEIRLQLANEAWETIKADPIGGVGPGLYHDQSSYGQGAHIAALMTWAETGIIALLGWIVLMFSVCGNILRRYKVAPAAATTLAGVFGGFFITSISVSYMYPRSFFLPLLAAFLLSLHTQPLARRRDRPRRPAPTLVASQT